jgi:cyclophilin family peptidyl-prolyl cis-trans isomerase
MSWDAFSYRFIKENGFTSPHAVVRTASTEAMGTVLSYPDFANVYRTTQRRVKNEMIQNLKEAIESGDAAMIAVASGILKNESFGLKELIQDFAFLKTARDKLVLPRDIETYNEIGAAISYFEGKKDYEPSKLGFNHPINWENLSEFSDSSIVRISTDKGEIDLVLFKKLAPGSVSNFLQLSKDGYYDNKGFHRVVPNFVIQGGCPRGDGYGSLEYSIRSELSPSYYDHEGYLGMASAGNHTECTQWFITHSPTPHLDGNYTIFGKVKNGMDVVHAIEIGDSIRNVKILTL